MSDLFENHTVGFPTRAYFPISRLTFNVVYTRSTCLSGSNQINRWAACASKQSLRDYLLVISSGLQLSIHISLICLVG